MRVFLQVEKKCIVLSVLFQVYLLGHCLNKSFPLFFQNQSNLIYKFI